MKHPKIFYLNNELNELHENELVIVFNEFGDEIISGYLRKEMDNPEIYNKLIDEAMARYNASH